MSKDQNHLYNSARTFTKGKMKKDFKKQIKQLEKKRDLLYDEKKKDGSDWWELTRQINSCTSKIVLLRQKLNRLERNQPVNGHCTGMPSLKINSFNAAND